MDACTHRAPQGHPRAPRLHDARLLALQLVADARVLILQLRHLRAQLAVCARARARPPQALRSAACLRP